MSQQEQYKREKLLRLEAGARIHNAARAAHNEEAQHHLLNEYVDDLRQCRKINVKQWEVGRALVGDWHGTAEDFLTAIKELA